MLLFNATLITLMVIPGFYFLQSNNLTLLILVLVLFTIASSLEQGTTPIALVENFPLPARYTGVALGYNLGNGFLGGTVPLICGWLFASTHFYMAPAIYIMLCALTTWLVVFMFVPETYDKKLT
jgi:hypothetical protein